MGFRSALGVLVFAGTVVGGVQVKVQGGPRTPSAAIDGGGGPQTGSVSEVICPEDANDFDSPYGGLVFGDALDLCDSDDVRLVIDNRLTVSLLLPFVRVDTWAYTSYTDAHLSLLEYVFEGGATAIVPGGQNADALRMSIYNYDVAAFELVDQRATGSTFVDEVITHAQAVDIDEYVQVGDREIRGRLDAFDPGDAVNANWQLRVDRFEVTVTNTPLVETVCPGDAGDYMLPFGVLVSGDAADLCASDDVRLRAHNKLPPSVLLPFVRVETWAHTSFDVAQIVSLDYTVEGGVTAIVSGPQNPDTMRTSIFNYVLGDFELVDQRGTASPFADEVVTHTQSVDAPDYVQAGDGEIRVRIDAFRPGDATNANWRLRLDLFEVAVTDF